MIPVILSGGSGTRLWPLSRGMYPKQFLPLVSDRTMVQETVCRLQDVPNLETPIVVCNENHRFIVAEQLREIGITPAAILLEPEARNTAPAIALAALTVDPEEILLVLPSDHVIKETQPFHAAVAEAHRLAEEGLLVTFGIVPTAAHTGYGYIKRGTSLGNGGGWTVAAFVEKPDRDTARVYLDSGRYLWSSGIFMFRAGRILEELERYEPVILASCRKARELASIDLDFVRIDREAFESCPADSIDYAVMERTDQAVTIPLDAGWSDVGSWSALWDVLEKDEDGNAIRGDAMVFDTHQSIVQANGKLVTAVGVENLVIIDTDDAVMVAPMDRVEDVKHIVARLKEKQRGEAELHRKVYRPWGYYDSIDNGHRFQAKRIVVKPGAKLSLQMHHHRAEHWVVVKGTAKVTKGEETLLLSENESTFIPIGTSHRLENPGVIPLEIVEVQSGSYLGEDDIVRFDDTYGRR